MKTARDKRESMPDSEAVRRVGYSVCELLDCCASWTLRWESYRTSEELRFRLEKAAKIDYTVGIGRFGCCGSPSRRRVPRDEPRLVHASAAWSREHSTLHFYTLRSGTESISFYFAHWVKRPVFNFPVPTHPSDVQACNGYCLGLF